MPRLSRTQKFAELRDQLSNDKEESLNTQDLSAYQNRLNNFQSDLGNVQQNFNYNQQPVNNGYQEAPMNFASQQPVNNVFANYQEAPINEENPISVSPAYKSYQNVYPANSINNNNFGQTPSFNGSMNVNNTQSFNQPAFVEQPINQQVQNENSFVQQEIKTEIPVQQETESYFNQPAFVEQPINQQMQNENPFVQQEEKAEAPIQEEVKPEPQNQASSFFGDFMNGVDNSSNSLDNDFNSYFESNNYSSIDEVFSDVNDYSGEMVSQKERDTYLNQAINDATRYGENNSQQTIDSIINNSVDEVRHTDNKTDSFDVLSGDIDDEEFSNTVSMEITKIMDEVSASKVDEPVENNQPIYLDETPVQQVQINKIVAEEKPEEVVEIKNISEMASEPVNTMSNTIPFVVAEDDEEVLDDEEEDGSNTVLNIILIVLIVVLVAVLGLIVFYILKTKGIF